MAYSLVMPHISIRVSEKEKADYRELADSDGRDLTEIIKTYLNKLIARSHPAQRK